MFANNFRRGLAASHLLVLLCAFSCGLLSAQQASSTKPLSPVVIENTNAAFAPSDKDIPEANPARPTITTPARIPPTGFLQFEQGIDLAGRSPSGTRNQLAVSQVSKIAVTTRLLFQFLGTPYAYSTLGDPGDASTHSNDPGDLQLGVQAILHKAVGSLPTVALAYIRRVRSGTAPDIDLGSFSQSAQVLLGGDLTKGTHYDVNLIFNEQNDDPVRRAQFLQTLSLSHNLLSKATHDKLGGTVELAHFTQPFVIASRNGFAVSHPNAYDLLFVGTYTVHPNLVLDASVSRGLTSTSTSWQAGGGFSYIFPHRLWPDKHPRVLPVGRVHTPSCQ